MTKGDFEAASATEGDSAATAFAFTVQLSAPATGPVEVDFTTADSTATASADYVPAAGTITIPADSTSASISIQVNGDIAFEPDEHFIVRLSNPVNAIITDSIAVATILNDDPMPQHRPRLLSDKGPCFISKELGTYLEERSIAHTRGKPYHPMTQGKIERYHRTLKNVLLLQNHWLPGALEQEIERFVQYYNHERVHESLQNLTPADVYRGRGREILSAREKLKRQTLRRRARINRGLPVKPEERILPFLYREGVS